MIAVGAALTVACAPRPVPPMPMPQVGVAVLQGDSIATALMTRAFRADAELRNPDSLYVPNAEIVANGAPRGDAPRFAGVDSGGSVQIGSSRIAVSGSFVWGTAQYRWVPKALGGKAVEGWATFVIGQLRDGSWRVFHAHSSTSMAVRDTTGS